MGPILTIHSFFSLSWDEWGSIVAILGAVIVILRWLLKRTRNDIVGPLLRQMADLTRTIKDITAWQLKTGARLDDGDKKFAVYGEKIHEHDRRIDRLEEMQHHDH